ncbi:MAG: hypothetical protein QNK03_09635 [Myxococcota bacterium]|nr:hypothetical protein [Myxococcota bacterium]
MSRAVPKARLPFRCESRATAIEPELRERECAIGWSSQAVAPTAQPQEA